MTALLRETIDDIHHGQETWRVRVMLAIPAAFIAVAVALIRLA